jgi:serine/threonine-protein kinase RsbW
METVNQQKKVFGDFDQIPTIRKWVIDQLIKCNVTDEILNDIKIALSEALTNIFKHAYKNEIVKPIRIKLMVDKEKAIISLRDFGEKFELSNYIPPNLKKASKSGYGIYMIRKLMDGVLYFPREVGTELLMWKSIAEEASSEHE